MTTTEPQPFAKPACEHHWIGHVRGGARLSVRTCSQCGAPDFADLDRQAAELITAALRDMADRIDRGPTFPLPPSVISALVRERADDLDAEELTTHGR